MSDRKQISRNFYLDEFTASETASRLGIDMSLDNEPLIETRLIYLATTVLQPLRNALGPVTITSGYRPNKLNKKLGGAANSDHLYGLAADIRVAGKSPLEVACWIRDNIENYKQVINEHDSWVHVSFEQNYPSELPRKEDLTAIRIKSFKKTVYVNGLRTNDDARNFYLNGV